MGSHKSNEQWKEELVGKRFGYLVVEDVYNRRALCKCVCGKEKEISIYHLLDGHSVSCGCYKKSEERSRKYSDWCRSNSGKVKSLGEKHSQWFKDNPDKVEEWKKNIKCSCNNTEYKEGLSERRKEYFKNNPLARLKYSQHMKSYYKDNPDKLKFLHSSLKLWYKSNPEKIKERSKKYSTWCKDHPEFMKVKALKHSEWCKQNRNFILQKAEEHKVFFQKNRKAIISDEGKQILKDILSKEDYNKFCSGLLSSQDKVLTKCPVCGKDIESLFGNIFILARNELKRELPKCATCRTSSSYEKELEDYIHSFYDSRCIRNSRDIIPPYELDLYYPDKKIAIEINGWFWHSTEFKNKKFHFLKWKYCLDHNIHLVSIFEQDLINKKEKVFSILKDLFITSTKLYARNCVVKKISKEERKEFFLTYHFDGDSNQSQVCYGLFSKDTQELLSCMSFGKLRGQNSLYKREGYYELVRYAVKSGIKVIGGASKLFSYFVKEYKPQYILSYSDNDFFIGEVYSKLGFSLKTYNENNIDYQWVKYKSVLNRQDTMVNKLLKKYLEYKDVIIEGSKEKYIMKDLGYLQVYRCGNTVWEWFNSQT